MKRLVLLLASASLLAAPAAWADPGGGKGHGKHGHEGGPPGLAKKPHGMPPGQAKKLWRQGERFPRSYYAGNQHVIAQPEQHHLRTAPAGYKWVLVEDDAYLVRGSNGMIADVVTNALAAAFR